MNYRPDKPPQQQLQSEGERKRAICKECPHIVRWPFDRCGLCHCPIATKTRAPGASCPDKRW